MDPIEISEDTALETVPEDDVIREGEISTPRLYEVNPAPTDPHEHEKELGLLRSTFGKFFSDDRQFEHFAMLPLRKEDRMHFIQSCIKYQTLAKTEEGPNKKTKM